MGHAVFVVLHLAALLFGAFALVLTIPLHLIYGAVASRKPKGTAPDPEQPRPETHVRCPSCKELVRPDAVKCKHCGASLDPAENRRTLEQAQLRAREAAKENDRNIAIGVALAAAFIAALVFIGS